MAGIRRELGVRTIFNLLGPLANPAGARHQVMGVYEPRWVPGAGGASWPGSAPRHAFVVHGEGLDEIAVTGMTHVCEVSEGRCERYSMVPEDVGLPRCPVEALAGGDAGERPHPARRARRREGSPARRGAANAAAALVAAGAAGDLRSGVPDRRRESIDHGAAREKLRQLAAVTTRRA